MPRGPLRAGFAAAALLAGSATGVSAVSPQPLRVTGPASPPGASEVIVRVDPGVSAASASRAAALAGGRARPLGLGRLHVVRTGPGQSRQQLLARLRRSPDVTYAQPNVVHSLDAVPDDPWFGQQYALHNTGQLLGGFTTGVPDADADLPEAWDITTGGDAAVIAVVDSGIALDNPDIAPNLWTNPGESGGGRETNGVDDDGNGYVDDWRGYDVLDNDNDPTDESPFPHGTSAASIAGARGNDGFGVTGAAQRARIMALRASTRANTLSTSDIIEAFAYARRNGARIVNASFSGNTFDRAEYDAMAAAPEVLFVVSAGNDSRNVDTQPRYPCAFDLENIVCVGASDHRDQEADFTNWGPRNVDLHAGGYGVLASVPALEPRLTDGFEETLTGRWVTGGVGGAWSRTDTVRRTGAWSLQDSPGAYSPGANHWIRTATPLNLGGLRGCRVDFLLRLDSQRNVDGLIVEASINNGVTWTSLASFSGSSGGEFLPIDVDLEALEGQPAVLLRFRFVSDGTTNGDGAHIDDVSLACLGTTFSGRDLYYTDGTSFSAPVVAGIAGLLVSAAPELGPAEYRAALLTGVDRLPAFAGRVATGGRANALLALRALPPAAITGGTSEVGRTVGRLTGFVRTRGQNSTAYFEYGLTPAYGMRTPDFAAGGRLGDTPVSRPVAGLDAGRTYHYRLVVTTSGGTSYGANTTFATAQPEGQTAGTGDRAAPTLDRLTLTRARNGRWTLRLRTSEAIELTGLVEPGAGGRGRVIRTRLAAGTRSVPIRTVPAPFTVTVVGTDSAGNISRPQRVGARKVAG